jgi:glycosyltransferase involved in cell wall biosynthesis
MGSLSEMKRICYVLLSASPGMHDYTADLIQVTAGAGYEVHLVTTVHAPRDDYGTTVTVHTPVAATHAGPSPEALRPRALRDLRTLCALICDDLRPDVVHLTGPHPWNVALMRALQRQGLPAVHSLHALDSDRGLAYGLALRLWNRRVIRAADHVLVHGPAYRQRLLVRGLPVEQVTWIPLLRLFLGESPLEARAAPPRPVAYEPWALYLGSLERRRGLEHLITACALMDGAQGCTPRLVVAGPGDLSAVWAGPLPEGLEVRARAIDDRETADLLGRCGLLVLPHADWDQTARVAAAYYYSKPVVVTRFGALPECVVEGRTGYVVEPGHPTPLARRLEELLDDPARLAQMGAAGRAWYDTQCAQEERTLIDVYARLAERRAMPERAGQLSDQAIRG